MPSAVNEHRLMDMRTQAHCFRAVYNGVSASMKQTSQLLEADLHTSKYPS